MSSVNQIKALYERIALATPEEKQLLRDALDAQAAEGMEVRNAMWENLKPVLGEVEQCYHGEAHKIPPDLFQRVFRAMATAILAETGFRAAEAAVPRAETLAGKVDAAIAVLVGDGVYQGHAGPESIPEALKILREAIRPLPTAATVHTLLDGAGKVS